MTQTKDIDPAALAGLTTGVLMTDFSALHEAAEHVMGYPIWTHQFPVMSKAITAAVLKQFPEMPTEVSADGWEATRDAVRRQYNATVSVARGQEEGISPLDPAGFPEGLRARVNGAAS